MLIFVKGLLTKQWNPMPDKNSKFAEQAEDKRKIKEKKREKEKNKVGGRKKKITADIWARKATWCHAERINYLSRMWDRVLKKEFLSAYLQQTWLNKHIL